MCLILKRKSFSKHSKNRSEIRRHHLRGQFKRSILKKAQQSIRVFPILVLDLAELDELD